MVSYDHRSYTFYGTITTSITIHLPTHGTKDPLLIAAPQCCRTSTLLMVAQQVADLAPDKTRPIPNALSRQLSSNENIEKMFKISYPGNFVYSFSFTALFFILRNFASHH